MRSDWEATIEQYATLKGWLIHHDRPARTAKGWRTCITGSKGFPDFLMTRWRTPGEKVRLVVIEAKTNSDKPTPHQRAWLDHFRQYGAEVYVFYPKDQQTMEKVLE
jgi:hypothetical protein